MKPREFRTVSNLCLVDFSLMNLPVSESEALALLGRKNIELVSKDIVEIARSVVRAPFQRNCLTADAPRVFDCSSLTQWVYGQIGFELPRLPIQQWEVGTSVNLDDAHPGDLIFAQGRRRNRYSDDPRQDIGHVGLVVGDNAAIYTHWRCGVVERKLNYFMKDDKFRGIRRVANLSGCHVLKLPPNRLVTSADDIKWLVLDKMRLLTKPR